MYQASVPVFRHYLSRISDIVAIDADPLRDESFRTSADYAAHCRDVSRALARATATEAA